MILRSEESMMNFSTAGTRLTLTTNLSISRNTIPSSTYKVASFSFSAAKNVEGWILVISIRVDEANVARRQ